MKSFEEYFEMTEEEDIEILDEAVKKRTTTTIENIAKDMGFPFKHARKIWKMIYKSALKQYGDEGRAIATANAGLKTSIKAKQSK